MHQDSDDRVLGGSGLLNGHTDVPVNGLTNDHTSDGGSTSHVAVNEDTHPTYSSSLQTNGLGRDSSDFTNVNDHLEGKGSAEHVVEPVAIVGMAMRLPGGIHNADDFWDLLINKRNGQCRVPKDRYNIDAWYGPGKSGHVGTRYGYFLEDLNLTHIDASFWSMTKQEAELMDPQQRLILEVVYEALENAGAKNWRGRDIGCYVGIFGEDWVDMDSKDVQNSRMYRLTGYGDYVTANRVSYEFDFKGPRYVG